MKPFTVSVKKLTDEELMREACETTFIGTSKQTLLSIYRSEHSPARTQMFWIKFVGIPLASSTHIIRHHVGSQPYQLTCRDDRNGGNPKVPERIKGIVAMINAGDYEKAIEELEWLSDNSDRMTPVNLSILVNAQGLLDMAKLRLCNTAHPDTVAIFKAMDAEIRKVDPDLANLMVRKCVYRGGICCEPRCCGFNSTDKFKQELKEYLGNFTKKQRGMLDSYFG